MPPKAKPEAVVDTGASDLLSPAPEAAAGGDPSAAPAGEDVAKSASDEAGDGAAEQSADNTGLAEQLAAVQAELAEVTAAAETAISELVAQRDALAAGVDALTAERDALAAKVAEHQTAVAAIGDAAVPLRILETGETSGPVVEAAEIHEGPFVVMKTSSIAGRDGPLIARNRVATGEIPRLAALIEDDKARRATVREVEAAQAKDLVAILA